MSTIIIRLQNLPLSAKAADIREFFEDLKIPKGSVNIVGGPNGDAFIGFQTDEDARQAMLRDGRLLHKAKIHLMLSSRREMEQVITQAQAMAGAAKQAGAPIQQHFPSSQAEPKGLDGGVLKQPAELKDGGQWKTHTEAASATSVPQSLPFGLVQSQSQPSQTTTVRDFPQPFSGDSWKTPQTLSPAHQPVQPSSQPPVQQNQSLPSHAPLPGNTDQQQQPIPVFPGSTQAPFGGGVPPAHQQPSLGGGVLPPTQQHQYQQLAPPPQQLPGFPPPLNIPAQPQQQLQFQQHHQQLRPPIPPFPSNVPNNGFFNQQQQQPPNSSGPHQRLPPPFLQQQLFGGILPPPPFGSQGPKQPFRPPPPQQQPFGRRGATGQQFGHGGGGFRAPGGGGGQTHPPQQFQRQQPYRQRFEGGGGDGGGKRPRSRSPPTAETAKRFFPGSGGTGPAPAPMFSATIVPSIESTEKERICIQLSNVPYKATFKDLREYLGETKAECVKVTRVYPTDKNYSDRWIVEVDNEKDAKAVIRHRGDINNRTIRAERISARKADEQYAVAGQDEGKDEGDGGNRRSEDPRRESRDRGRDRDRSNRERGSERSKSPAGRGGSSRRDRGTTRDAESEKTKMAVWAKDEQRSADEKKKGDEGGTHQHRKDEKMMMRDEKPVGVKTADQPQLVQPLLQRHPQPPPTAMQPSGAPMNFITNAAAFGAFSFPDNQNNAAYRPKHGGTVQIGGKDGPIPLRAFELFPHPPNGNGPRLPIPLNHLGGHTIGQQKMPSPPINQHSAMPLIGQIPPLIRPATNDFWPVTSSTNPLQSNNPPPAILQQHPINSSPLMSPTNSIPTAATTTTSSLLNATLDSTVGPTGLVIQEDLSMDEGESDSDVRIPPRSSTISKDPMRKSSFTSALNGGVPDQPPLDLLEPEHESSITTFNNPMMKTERRSFDSAPLNREYTPQEVDLRPHLVFLERYKADPNSNSCIRLENVPKMVYAEQLSQFLGVHLSMPCENIARMQNGVLYINLANEALASKAMLKNTHFLDGHQIAITQLKKAEMADAIRQNMIIIREMYRVSVVARGFPLTTQPNEVIALFERFNLNKDGVEKCAIKQTDSTSTFLLTFPTAQDCRNALALDKTKIVSGGHIQVFQPTEGIRN